MSLVRDEVPEKPLQERLVEVSDGVLPGLDPARVAPWFLSQVPSAQGPLAFGLIAAGGSNLTYRVDDASGGTWILRRPPVGTLLASAHDVLREYRIMAALQDSAIPVPRCVATCADPEVSDAALSVYSYEAGWIFRDVATARAAGPAGCRQAAYSLFDTLAELHLVEPGRVGLEGLARSDGYIERQLKRWHKQYLQTAADAPKELELALHDRLMAKMPADLDRGAVLVHGDYHIDNAIFDGDFNVRAVVDWELSTLGHPIADLGWAMIFWSAPGEPSLMEPVTEADGFPSREELAQRYAEKTGFGLDDLNYCMALSYWKLACLSQGALYRSRRGSSGGLQQAGTFNEQASLDRIQVLFELSAQAASSAGA